MKSIISVVMLSLEDRPWFIEPDYKFPWYVKNIQLVVDKYSALGRTYIDVKSPCGTFTRYQYMGNHISDSSEQVEGIMKTIQSTNPHVKFTVVIK